ncbi:hypothetical protein [Kitasatospora sp. NPDC088548]|uniref:hypothetical protein n=1 Tax=Kitasatospora sp. NPDC088548 TaxID=3364075 RepID=UPI0037F39F21
MTKVRIRKSVPLTDEDQVHLQQLRTPGTPEHEALSQVTGMLLPDDASEAETPHALLLTGRAAVTEQVMIGGYAALAAAEDNEDRADRRAVRTRAAHRGD